MLECVSEAFRRNREPLARNRARDRPLSWCHDIRSASRDRQIGTDHGVRELIFHTY